MTAEAPVPRSRLLPRAVESVGAARRLLARDLDELGIEGVLRDDALMVLSELFTNSVRYGRPLSHGQIRVAWSVQPRRIELRVTDGGGVSHPRVRHAGSTEIGGRGLEIVDALAQEWGVAPAEAGVTVWAVLGPDHRR